MLRRDLVPASTVLKVARQGSRTSSTAAFLDAVLPQLAVIMVGDENRFGHPHQETMNALETRLPAGSVLTTVESGTVTVTSDGRRLWVDTER